MELFLLVILTFFVDEIDTCFSVSSWAKSRFDLQNIVQIISNIVRILVVVALFSILQPNVAFVGLGTLLAAIISLIGDLFFGEY